MNIDTVAMNEISKKWGWILAVGVLMVILGTIGIGATFALTLTTVMFFGILILIGSGFQLLDAFRYKGWSLIGKMLIALLYLAVGFIMVKNPLLASTTLTLFIAWALIAVGIVRIIMAFQLRGVDGWIWTLISGIAVSYTHLRAHETILPISYSVFCL